MVPVKYSGMDALLFRSILVALFVIWGGKT
jgi:hypothetical protein